MVVAVSMIAILSIVALSLDGGMMLDKRRQIQTASDAAALAGTDDLYARWYTNATSGKVKRVRNNGRARVAACDAVGKLKGEFVDAKARLLGESDANWQRGWDTLHAKYWMLGVGLFVSRLTGRYKQRGLIAVELGA